MAIVAMLMVVARACVDDSGSGDGYYVIFKSLQHDVYF